MVFRNEIVATACREWPATFALTEVDRISGYALRCRTLRNKRSLGQIPKNCFFRDGRKLLVHRDRFLAWWDTQLQPCDE